MAELELVPQIPVEGVQRAHGELASLTLTLEQYEAKAKAIVVDSPQKYLEAGELMKAVRDNKKQGAWVMNPLKSIAKTITDKFRTMELAHANKATQIEGILEAKMVEQKRRERDAAAAEERRINEEARKRAEAEAEERRQETLRLLEEEKKRMEKELKAQVKDGDIGKREAERLRKEAEAKAAAAKAEADRQAEAEKQNVQAVKVSENTPKIAGLRQRINWYAECSDLGKLLEGYVKADPVTRGFLQQFLMADDKAIAQFARQVKADDVVMSRIPGTRAWHEDSI